MSEITVIGGGLAGLTAAITGAEGGAEVQLFEAHEELGGRARSTDGPYKANLGPHAIYTGGVLWDWLTHARTDAAAGPAAADRRSLSLRGRRPPHAAAQPDPARPAPARRGWRRSTRTSARGSPTTRTRGRPITCRRWPACTPSTTTRASCRRRSCGSAASVCCSTRGRRRGSSSAGGRAWSRRSSGAPASSGVQIVCGERVDALPVSPVIVALELRDARVLLGDETLRWASGRTVCLDLGLRERRGDPWIVSDLETAGWLERYTAQDPSLAPAGEQLVQAQMPIRPGESVDEAGGAAGAPARRFFGGLARARHLAPATGDGRPQRRARPARRDVAGPAGDRPRRRACSCAAIRSRRTAAWPRFRSPARSTPAPGPSSTRADGRCARPHDLPAGWNYRAGRTSSPTSCGPPALIGFRSIGQADSTTVTSVAASSVTRSPARAGEARNSRPPSSSPRDVHEQVERRGHVVGLIPRSDSARRKLSAQLAWWPVGAELRGSAPGHRRRSACRARPGWCPRPASTAGAGPSCTADRRWPAPTCPGSCGCAPSRGTRAGRSAPAPTCRPPGHRAGW